MWRVWQYFDYFQVAIDDREDKGNMVNFIPHKFRRATESRSLFFNHLSLPWREVDTFLALSVVPHILRFCTLFEPLQASTDMMLPTFDFQKATPCNRKTAIWGKRPICRVEGR